MAVMDALVVPGPWTVAERDSLPDDRHRHELIDGVLVVTTSPGDAHQSLVGGLYYLLRVACPSDLRVRLAPYDVTLAADTVLQPDLIVCRQTDITPRGLVSAPLLAVEVLSPSTESIDRGLKLNRLAVAGTPSYWLVDPIAPSLTAYALRDGTYVEVAHVQGDEEWTAVEPFPVAVRPGALRD